MSEFPIEDLLKPECDSLRADLLAIEKRCRELKFLVRNRDMGADPEVYANAMLAVRHIEDARMRLGKVLQYARDGVSCFDHAKEST